MAYGPLAQCAFMSGPSPFKKKAPPGEEKKQFKDLLPPWKPPDRCEAPPPGSFMLYCFDMEEIKDPNATSRSLPLDEMSHVTFGSSQEVDGLVYDGNKGVRPEHAAIYYMKSRWFLKAVNGPVTVESMTLHPHLKDSDGKPPKRYTSASTKKMETIEPMDAKKKLTREFCVFRLGDSERRFWIGGPLPLGDGETEEAGGTEGRKKERKERADRERDRDKDHNHKEHKEHKEHKDRDRKEDRDHRSRTRSRSRKRRR
mmetsp:Transcript_18860/g.23201  ORF Transcript_18860/g.23201 Transcript_18860/m.23201 type:complete len:256 (+) Transcript_18860:69-836(+)